MPASPPHVVLDGGPGFRSELLNSAEIGYRAQPMAALSYSVSAFISAYDQLRSLEPSPTGPQFANGIQGTLTGIESWANYRIVNPWRISVGATALHHELELDADSQDLNQLVTLDDDPDHWWVIRNAFDVMQDGELDVIVRQIAALPSPTLPRYTPVDARVSWRFVRELELSVTGTDLLGPRHAEWGPPSNRATFGRSVFAQAEWRH